MLKKILLGVLALIVLGIAFVYFRFTVLLPRDIPVWDITLPTSAEEIERGRYIANHVAVCMDCHSTRNWNYFSGPIVPGTLGGGGEIYGREIGLPGHIVSKNITPYALGDWSDGEVHRAVTGGLQKDGDPLFTLMPYDGYRVMEHDEVLAIIAYLRTLEPVANDTPDHELDFPLSLIVNSMPLEAEPRTVNRDDPVEYGDYLSKMAGCTWCHTPVDQTMQSLWDQKHAGGMEFITPGKRVVRASNISPDKATGIGNWTLEQFIARFRMYQGEAGRTIPLDENGNNTMMPWTMYADMKDEDLAAIYAFLMASEPQVNEVAPWQ
jgi:mono/diheme cytochrome c family protein